MSSLCNILQRCARNASLKSILGGTPLQIQCTFNPVYSAYPTSISRQAYSSDANEAPKNDPVQKYLIEMMNAKKSRSKIAPEDQKASKSNIAEDQKDSNAPTFTKTDSMNSRRKIIEDQKASKTPTFNKTDSMNSRPNIKSWPSVSEDQKASNASTFNKNLNLRKYYIAIRGLFNEITLESLRKFYSQFGEIAVCNILFPGEPNEFGNVAFTSKEAMYRALNSLPHCIDGKVTRNIHPSILGPKQLTLQVSDLSPKTTYESLKAFYCKFGWLTKIRINQGIGFEVGEVTFSNQEDMHRALDAQPHVIDGSEVLLLYATFDLDFEIEELSEGMTEEELIAFYSKYGKLRQCRIFKGRTGIPHAYVSFSAIDEFNRAMDDRPHIINGKPMKIQMMGKSHSKPVALFIGCLPENVTEETLRKEFSKYGKPVFWKLENDGQFNQSGPYGIVTFATEQEALKALNNGPHTIEGAVVDVRKAKDARRRL